MYAAGYFHGAGMRTGIFLFLLVDALLLAAIHFTGPWQIHLSNGAVAVLALPWQKGDSPAADIDPQHGISFDVVGVADRPQPVSASFNAKMPAKVDAAQMDQLLKADVLKSAWQICDAAGHCKSGAN